MAEVAIEELLINYTNPKITLAANRESFLVEKLARNAARRPSMERVLPSDTDCFEGFDENPLNPLVQFHAVVRTRQAVEKARTLFKLSIDEPIYNQDCCICMGDHEDGKIVQIDCGHHYHLDCLLQQVGAGWTGDRITSGYLACALCREDLAITPGRPDRPRAKHAAKKLRSALVGGKALRAEVFDICFKQALAENAIEGLASMAAAEARAAVEKKMAAYTCAECAQPFCAGKVECADAAGGVDVAALRCPECTMAEQKKLLGKVDFSRCKEPMYKCDLCCSVAKYRCPDYYQCEKHHSGRKHLELCPGPGKCPLGVEHPQNAHKRRGFIIGCGCGKCK
eukprot:g9.t1